MTTLTPSQQKAAATCATVQQLRTYMRAKGLDAFIFPSSDPHSGEYVPAHWMTREWISGFTGSAGTAVVTLHKAALWTDSRYFLQAAAQLDGTPFELMRDGLPETPTIEAWLKGLLPEGSTVGMDGWVNTIDALRAMDSRYFRFRLDDDPAAELWASRPAIPLDAIERQPIELAGQTCQSKLLRLREALQACGADGTVVSQLDEVAWLTNLRGSDVHCTPVFVAYLLVTMESATLFVHQEKVTPQVAQYLEAEGITVLPYDALTTALRRCTARRIMLDTAASNWQLQAALPEGCELVEHASLVAPMKAVKNEAEIRGFRQAMIRDGVALVRFLRWLGPAVEAGGQTELSVDEHLTALRAAQPLFRGLSFDTIAGYAAHGAIVHYEATDETSIPLQPHGLLLLDSGAQYQDGTTDITRTIALGPLTQQEKLDYTLVLKGHIRLALTKFPDGACGTQIDALARYAMWQEGINYLHGTGHGVGSYLSVHEGPHQIRMNYRPAPLHAGMIVTNEPGIYRAGQHGVRTENTMLVTPYCTTDFGTFLQLEPLTLCPIDTRPILLDRMAPDELDYLNAYHQRVYDTLSPLLDEEDRDWLREATRRIG